MKMVNLRMGLRSFWSSVSVVSLLSFTNDSSPSCIFSSILSYFQPMTLQVRSILHLICLVPPLSDLCPNYPHFLPKPLLYLRALCPCFLSCTPPIPSLVSSKKWHFFKILKIPLHLKLRIKSKVLIMAYKNPWSGLCSCLQEYLLSHTSFLLCFSHSWFLIFRFQSMSLPETLADQPI